MLSEVMPADVSEGLAHIMDTVTEVAEADFGLEFDPLWSEACHIIQELFSRSPWKALAAPWQAAAGMIR